MSLHISIDIGPNGLRMATEPRFERILDHAVTLPCKEFNGSLEFVKIFDFLVTAKMSPAEKWLMCVLLHLEGRKAPSQKELARIAQMNPNRVKPILQALHKRGMLNFDKIRVNHMSEKTLIDITAPCHWSGVFSGSSADYSYAVSPLLLLELNIPYKAKLVWLLFASISKFEHPTEQQISEVTGISADSVRKYLRILRDRNMLSTSEFRLKMTDGSYCLLRIHNTVAVSQWDFRV